MIEGTLTELSTKLKFANAPLAKKRQILIDIHGARCFYCGATPDYFEVDHVHPKSRGGTDELTNLVLSCVACNQTKGGCGINDMHSQPRWLKEAVMRTLQRLSPLSERKFAYMPAQTTFHLNGDIPVKQPAEITEFGELLEQHRIQSGLSKKGILKRLNSFEKKWNNYLTNSAIFGESQLPRLAKLLSIPLETLESAYIRNCFAYALERPSLSQVWKKPFLQAFIESCDIENRIHAFLREYPEKIKSVHPCYGVIQNLKIGRPPGKRGRDRIEKEIGFEVFPSERVEAFRSQLRHDPPPLIPPPSRERTLPVEKANGGIAHHNENKTPVWFAPPIITESNLRKKLRQEFDEIIAKGSDKIKMLLSSPEIMFVFQPLFSNFREQIRKFVDGRSYGSIAMELGIHATNITGYIYGHSFPSPKTAAILKEKADIDVLCPSIVKACYDLIDTIPMTDKGDIRVESIRRLKKEGLFYSEGAVNLNSIQKGRAIFASWKSGKPVPAQLKKRWTDAEIDQLRELVGAGKSDTEIAEILGRPKDSIRKKRIRELSVFRKVGRPRKQPVRRTKRWTEKEVERLRALVSAGKSDAEIAAMIGRSQTAVMQKRKYGLGIDYRKHWTDEEDARLKQLLTETDKPLSEIAKILGRGEGGIERRKERLGIRRVPFKLDRFNPMHVAQLLKFKSAGWTQEQIAKVWGIKNPAQISHVLRSHGFYRFCVCVGEKTCVRWTDAECDTLRDCIEKGMSPKEIQDAWLPNRSIPAIKQKIKRLPQAVVSAEPIRVERKSWQPQVTVTRNMSVREMRDAELTIDEIAEITGKSRVEVFKELSGGS